MYSFLMEVGATPANGAQQNMLMQFLPFILIAVVFYLFIIRPQQKKQKEHQAMIDAIAINDEVFTSSGIKGKVVNIKKDKNIIVLRVDDTTGTKIEFQREVITTIVKQ
ncbi:MAG: preprotein translocase subunit YajC [Candidatus Cloacimonetes bacterium]|nr:preprotein translocase subunit YajC [Candidatus Cloacimonadota bacterium]